MYIISLTTPNGFVLYVINISSACSEKKLIIKEAVNNNTAASWELSAYLDWIREPQGLRLQI